MSQFLKETAAVHAGTWRRRWEAKKKPMRHLESAREPGRAGHGRRLDKPPGSRVHVEPSDVCEEKPR